MNYNATFILAVIALILTVASFIWPGPLLQIAVAFLAVALLLQGK